MTESERDEIKRILERIYAGANDPSRKLDCDDARKLNTISVNVMDAYKTLVASEAAPSISGFALVGPDGKAIAETVSPHEHPYAGAIWRVAENIRPKVCASPFGGSPSLALEWLAAHGYTIRPVRIVVEEQTEEPRQ